jgi:hypothetical protein
VRGHGIGFLLVTRNTSPLESPSSASVATKCSLLLSRWETSDAKTLRISFLSSIPSRFVGPTLTCILMEGVTTHRNFEKHELLYEEWVSVLHLSIRWGFGSLRKLALASMKPPTPHDRLLLACTYSIDNWVLPALSALCERTAPLNLDEARQMRIEDVVIVATVRENIRDLRVRVDAAEIRRRVEAAQAGKPSTFEGVDVPPAGLGTFRFDCALACSQTFTFGGVNVLLASAKTITAASPVDLGLAARAKDVADNLVSSVPAWAKDGSCATEICADKGGHTGRDWHADE